MKSCRYLMNYDDICKSHRDLLNPYFEYSLALCRHWFRNQQLNLGRWWGVCCFIVFGVRVEDLLDPILDSTFQYFQCGICPAKELRFQENEELRLKDTYNPHWFCMMISCFHEHYSKISGMTICFFQTPFCIATWPNHTRSMNEDWCWSFTACLQEQEERATTEAAWKAKLLQ